MTEPSDLQARYLREDVENDRFVMEALLKTAQGRKWLRRQLAECGIGRQPFSSNALQMSFNCGELNAGNRLLSEILSTDPDNYVLMLKEGNDEQSRRDEQLYAARTLADPDAE